MLSYTFSIIVDKISLAEELTNDFLICDLLESASPLYILNSTRSQDNNLMLVLPQHRALGEVDQ